MMQGALLILIIYAACGFLVSTISNLLGLAGLQPSDNAVITGLGAGLIPLWFFVVFIHMKLTNRQRISLRQGFSVTFSECPWWMGYLAKLLYVYALLNLALIVVIPLFLPAWMQRSSWLTFSSYMMLFNFAGLGTLITAYKKGYENLEPRCPNGHLIGLDDRYCGTCGTSIGGPSS